MNRFLIVLIVFLHCACLQAQELPKASKTTIVNTVNKIFPDAKIVAAATKNSFVVSMAGKSVGKLYLLQGKGVEDPFEFMVLTDNNKVIKNVEILSYTSKYGTQAKDRKWLKQFEGKKTGTIAKGKEVDAISGATVTIDEMIRLINTLK